MTSAGISLAARLLLGLIMVYRWTLSPLIGRSCRFLPTCSVYGLEAIARHGAKRGSWLTLRRLGRCHPWGGSGVDPVPPVKTDFATGVGPGAKNLDFRRS
ncbi:putative membrane protein insertion efficiency factor [uncultured Gammaproteobacteria bacterium]